METTQISENFGRFKHFYFCHRWSIFILFIFFYNSIFSMSVQCWGRWISVAPDECLAQKFELFLDLRRYYGKLQMLNPDRCQKIVISRVYYASQKRMNIVNAEREPISMKEYTRYKLWAVLYPVILSCFMHMHRSLQGNKAGRIFQSSSSISIDYFVWESTVVYVW